MFEQSDMVPNARHDTAPDAVIELGKKLVAELGLEGSVDTLGRWMAHYVAELIADVETANPVGRAAKEDRCAAAILELWSHRHEVPNGRGHFEPEPVLRAIANLDPDAPGYRHFAGLRQSADDDDGAVREWLRLADNIDATARMLIVECLVAAAAAANDRSREWISMAEAARIEDDAPMVALRFVNEQADLLHRVDPKEADREQLERRLGRLNAFMKLAKMLHKRLTMQLGAIAPPRSRSARRRKSVTRDKPKKARKSGKPRARRKRAKSRKRAAS